MAADLVLGVAVGYILEVLFLGILARFYIFTRTSWSQMVEAATFSIRPPAEAYLRFATHSFVSMIATGAIITLAFGGHDWNDTPYVREYGMNTLCYFFNLTPSTYVLPSYWLITAFCVIRYCILDTERLLRGETSVWCKYCGIATNGTFAVVAMLFSTAWSVGIEEDTVAHELPFLMLVMCIPLVYIMHIWEMSFSMRTTCLSIIVLSVYAHVSVFYALSIVALRYQNMNPDYVKPLQWLWVGLSAMCPPATYPAARSCLKPIDASSAQAQLGSSHVVEPCDPEDSTKVAAIVPIKIQVQPKRPETPEEPSFTTVPSQSSARTPESLERALAAPAPVREERHAPASRTAGAPLRFAMGLSAAESKMWRQNSLPITQANTSNGDWEEARAPLHKASTIMAEARSLAGSRPNLLEAATIRPCIGQVPPTSPCIGQVPPTSPPRTGQASSSHEASPTSQSRAEAPCMSPSHVQAPSVSPCTVQEPSPLITTLRSQGLLGLHGTMRSQRSARPGSVDGGVEVQLIGTGLLEAQERTPPEAAYAITQKVIKTAVSGDALHRQGEEASQEAKAEAQEASQEAKAEEADKEASAVAEEAGQPESSTEAKDHQEADQEPSTEAKDADQERSTEAKAATEAKEDSQEGLGETQSKKDEDHIEEV